MPPKVILAFDLYGTLLSTSSISKQLAAHLGDERAAAVATTWRTLQLEYTWRLNSMQKYEPFSAVTHRSLVHALRHHFCDLSDENISSVMAAYDALATFPDVKPALEALASNNAFYPLVFSNGTADMLENSVKRSPDLSPHANVFRELVSADHMQCFKPAPKFYEGLVERMGMKGQAGRVWLVSSNPFDVVGARAFGMQAAWVNREMGRRGWEDNLDPETGRPTIEVSSLEKLEAEIQAWMTEHHA